MAIHTRKSPPPKTSVPSLARHAVGPKAGPDTKPNSILESTVRPVTEEKRRQLIAEAAYYIAERRAFEAGHEVDDWLAAEGEIDAMLTPGS